MRRGLFGASGAEKLCALGAIARFYIRVFYDVADDVVEVLAIVPKSETTSWLAQFGKL